MAQTINTMLSVAHIDIGKIALNLSEFSLSGVLTSLMSDFSVEAGSKHIQLRFDCPDDCLMQSDASLLREIFGNLLNNAIQYTPDGGIVSVTLRTEGPQCVVTVKDSGIGIPKNAIESVFGRLFRAENARKVKASGSGLGLYVVRSFTTLLGGTVSCSSREEHGATFIVRLPSSYTLWQQKKS